MIQKYCKIEPSMMLLIFLLTLKWLGPWTAFCLKTNLVIHGIKNTSINIFQHQLGCPLGINVFNFRRRVASPSHALIISFHILFHARYSSCLLFKLVGSILCGFTCDLLCLDSWCCSQCLSADIAACLSMCLIRCSLFFVLCSIVVGSFLFDHTWIISVLFWALLK